MSNTKFAYVAHLYIGCLIQFDEVYKQICILTHDNFSKLLSRNNRKPILRPLNTIKEWEDEHACMLKNNDKIGINGAAKSISFLISKHFDLFGLIEAGEAIDATSLPDNPYKVDSYD